jgi:hypothetical protein
MRLLFPDFNQNWEVPAIFLKVSNIKSKKICTTVLELLRADGQTAKLRAIFATYRCGSAKGKQQHDDYSLRLV